MSLTTNVLKFANITSGQSDAYTRIELGAAIKDSAETKKQSVADIVAMVKAEYAPSVSDLARDTSPNGVTDLNEIRFKGLSKGAIYKAASAYNFFRSANIKIDDMAPGERNRLAFIALQITQQKSLGDLLPVFTEWSDDELTDVDEIELFLNDEYVELLEARRNKAKQPKPKTPVSSDDNDDPADEPTTDELSVSSDDNETSATDELNALLSQVETLITTRGAELDSQDITEYSRRARALSKLLSAINA